MKKSSGKSIRWIVLLLTALIASITICFLSGITYSIPERAQEIYGPAAPGQNIISLYLRSIQLIAGEEQLISQSAPVLEPFEIQISPGETPDQVIRKLYQRGLISDPDLFQTYLIFTGLDTQIQAGTFEIQDGLPAVEIAQILIKGGNQETTISILAGWRVEEIAESLPELGLTISPDQFLNEVRSRDLEGYLFPGTYQVKRQISAGEIADRMYQGFLNQISPDIENGWNQQGLSTREAVILASIIEREAVLEEEKPVIASVFLNRLKIEMSLSADPTVQYALGVPGAWWKVPLSAADLEVESPFNTYRNTGLPPGPICNPGINSLRAVAFPEQTTYYFFRSACDGSGAHQFSETFEEHLENACP